MEHDVEIARRATVDARLAFVGVEDACAFFNPRRHFHRDRTLTGYAALPAALAARINDQLAASAAGAAGASDGEKSLLVSHLSAAAAGGAIDGLLARRNPASLCYACVQT